MEKSINDKLNDLHRLAYDLCFDCNNTAIDTDAIYGAAVSEQLWSLMDGLYYKYLDVRINGHCSLSESLKFDLGTEEEKIDQWTERFKILMTDQ